MSETYRKSVKDKAGRTHTVNTDRLGNVWVYANLAQFTPEQAMTLAEAIVEAAFVADPESPGSHAARNFSEIPLPE